MVKQLQRLMGWAFFLYIYATHQSYIVWEILVYEQFFEKPRIEEGGMETDVKKKRGIKHILIKLKVRKDGKNCHLNASIWGVSVKPGCIVHSQENLINKIWDLNLGELQPQISE